MRNNKTIKGEKVGFLMEVFAYCNEKEYKGKGFLFKCCKGCKHNPIKNDQ